MPFNSCVALALNLFFHWCDEGAFPKDHQKTKWLKGCSSFSVTRSCPTLSNPMDCSPQSSSVLHYLPEFAQIYVHWVSDAIQLSFPLPLPSPFAFNLSQHQVFSNESPLCIMWPKYWSFSFSNSPSSDIQGWFPVGWTSLFSLQSEGTY